jgi:hypothetical protein
VRYFKGGQGRSDEQVEADGEVMLACMLAGVFGSIVTVLTFLLAAWLRM